MSPHSRLAAAIAALVGVMAAAPGAQAPAPRPASTLDAASEPAVPEKAGKEFRAFRLQGDPPNIDGLFDDPAWRQAQVIDDFIQNEPDNMAPPLDHTAVQVAFDDKYLYVAVRCDTKDPSTITTGLGRRDNLPPSDLIRMSFDPRHDHQNAYVFETNPSGMQNDYLFYDDTRQSPDYDAVWEVRTSISAEGWKAEYRIPFSQMRFTVTPGVRAVWGFNLRRDYYKAGGFDRWVPTPRGAAGFVSRFGHLVFDDPLAPPRRVELQPVVLARRADAPSDPADFDAEVGLDARVGLGTATTLSATINPDFGQVEQDPSVLNLSVFETFYPEKRPFFLEDSRTFVPSFPQLLPFHSRRIGRSPGRIAVPDEDEEISRPDQTTILGAAKVTGRKGRWVYGGISALTDEEFAEVETPVPGGAAGETMRAERLIEPMTSYNVVRVRRDSPTGQSNLGAIATAVVREGDANAFTGGPDFTFRWDRNRGSLTGLALATHAPVSGSQQDGVGAMSNFNYFKKYWGINGHVDYISPNFRNSDIGFLGSRINKTSINYGLNLMQPDPTKYTRSFNWFGFGFQSWNTDGLQFDNTFGSGFDIQFPNFWGMFGNASHDFERLDDLDSRGGPPIVKPSANNVFLGGRTDSRKTWQVFFNGGFTQDAEGGTSTNAAATLRFQVSSRLQGQVSGSYNWGNDVAQWITNEDATGDGVTDYIYGRLRRDVVSITGRATYAFSRDMTLEAYLQPFVAVGDYTDIRRLAEPNSFVFEPVTMSYDPDFNSKVLRSNVVFRWEYQRGSTFYLVWNLSTSDGSRPGVFDPWRDLQDTFTAPGTNIVMVKLTYWLGF